MTIKEWFDTFPTWRDPMDPPKPVPCSHKEDDEMERAARTGWDIYIPLAYRREEQQHENNTAHSRTAGS